MDTVNLLCDSWDSIKKQCSFISMMVLQKRMVEESFTKVI